MSKAKIDRLCATCGGTGRSYKNDADKPLWYEPCPKSRADFKPLEKDGSHIDCLIWKARGKYVWTDTEQAIDAIRRLADEVLRLGGSVNGGG